MYIILHKCSPPFLCTTKFKKMTYISKNRPKHLLSKLELGDIIENIGEVCCHNEYNIISLINNRN